MQQSTIGGLHVVINPSIDGYNTTKTWKTLAGTVEESGGNIQIGDNDAIASYFALANSFDVNFMLTIPAAPVADDDRFWGLDNVDFGNRGKLGFDITGTAFTIVAYDENGVSIPLESGSKTIQWKAAWTNTETSYRILCVGGRVYFYIGSELMAVTKTAPTTSVRVHISNATTIADTMLLGALGLQNIHYFS